MGRVGENIVGHMCIHTQIYVYIKRTYIDIVDYLTSLIASYSSPSLVIRVRDEVRTRISNVNFQGTCIWEYWRNTIFLIPVRIHIYMRTEIRTHIGDVIFLYFPHDFFD